MTTMWPVYIIVCSQIVVLYGLAAPTSVRLLRSSYQQRNPAWLAGQPELAARLGNTRAPVALCYGLATLWLLLLADMMATQGLDDKLNYALLLPAVCWIAVEAVIGAIDYRRVGRLIPPPARRRATLERRALGDFVHPVWLLPGLALLLGVAATYTTGYAHELIDGSVFGWRLVSLAVGAALWISTLRYCVGRKRNVVDDTLGPGYRQAEVIGTIACLYVFAGLALLKALDDVYAVEWLSSVTTLACGSVLLQVALLAWIARVGKPAPERHTDR